MGDDGKTDEEFIADWDMVASGNFGVRTPAMKARGEARRLALRVAVERRYEQAAGWLDTLDPAVQEVLVEVEQTTVFPVKGAE